MNTDPRPPESRLAALRRSLARRRGIALIITLTIMALLLIMATSLLVNMRVERAISASYADQVQAREAALAGLHTAIAQMDRFFIEATRTNALVATMPGRLYMAPISTASSLAYTNISMIAFTNGFSMLPPSKISYLGSWVSPRYCNLNNASYQWGKRYLPIANPLRQPNANPANPTEITYAEIYADWLPLLRRESSTMYDTSTLGGLTATNSMWGGYLSARYAFWIDDESVKVNLANASGESAWLNSSTNFLPDLQQANVTVTAPSLVYASIQPADGNLTSPHSTTVDPDALDLNIISTLKGNWKDVAKQLNDAQNSGSQWKPILSPEDALGVSGGLTMEQYQAAKFCLTTWSEDQNDFSQIFRRNGTVDGALMTRTNVGASNIDLPLKTLTKQQAMYNFIRTHLNSPRLSACFGGLSFAAKYPDSAQPFLRGGVNQIAANIVSYLTDQNTRAPYGAGSTETDPGKVLIPTGYCGLWKAAYMNEIAVSFYWKKGVEAGKTQYELWMGVYVELMNPYDVPLPGLGRKYNIFFPSIKVQCKTTGIPIDNTVSLQQMIVTEFNPVDPHTYKQPWKDEGVNWRQVRVATIPPPNPDKPDIAPALSQITFSFNPDNQLGPERAIRQVCPDPMGMVDWFDPEQNVTEPKLPGVKTITYVPTDPGVKTGADPMEDLWKNNPTIVSIAKNDPRVHAWYGPYGEKFTQKVTIRSYSSDTGQNPPGIIDTSGTGGPVDHTGGDYETLNGGVPTNNNRPAPERWSNYVITGAPMRSVGELGFIHTGKPWRSLSLQYAGAQEDEKISTVPIPDWAIMDLFAVNKTPIHGRINVNNAGWQGEYANSADQDHTVSEARSLPNLYPPWLSPGRGGSPTLGSLSSGTPLGRQTPSTSPTASPLSRTLAAALNFVRRNDASGCYANVDAHNRLVDAIIRRTPPVSGWVQTLNSTALGNPWRPYFTIGELCEVYRMNYYDLTSPGTSKNSKGVYTDAAREETIRRIANVLTTRSDVFAVWVVSEARGVNNIRSGESRLMAIVQRHFSPHPTSNDGRLFNQRWRIRQLRWITD